MLAVIFFDAAPEFMYRQITDARHGNDHVKGLAFQFLKGFPGGGHPCQMGRAGQIEAAVFLDNALRQASFLFHDEGVVGTGYQQDVVDLAGHQFMEDFER